jgi:hypothetical protein
MTFIMIPKMTSKETTGSVLAKVGIFNECLTKNLAEVKPLLNKYISENHLSVLADYIVFLEPIIR